MRWTFDGDQVRFDDMVGGNLEDQGVFTVAPWVRVDDGTAAPGSEAGG